MFQCLDFSFPKASFEDIFYLLFGFNRNLNINSNRDTIYNNSGKISLYFLLENNFKQRIILPLYNF